MEPRIFVNELNFNDGYKMTIGHSDIIIFTGANNAGKSLVLKDVDDLMSNKNAHGIVVTSLSMEYVGDFLEKIEDYKKKDGFYHLSGNSYSDKENFKKM